MVADALVFGLLAVATSVVVSSVSTQALRPVRLTGPAVRRWAGFVLVAVGVWFVVLAALPHPIIGV